MKDFLKLQRLAPPLIIALLLVGCGGGGGDFVGATSTTPGLSTTTTTTQPTDPGNPGSPTAQVGRLVIDLPLVSARAVKTDVRSFRVTLRQNSSVVLSRDFNRSDTSAQQLQIDNIPPGDYQLEVLYFSEAQTVLGTFRQDVTIAVGQTTTIGNLAFQNTTPDFEALRMLPAGTFSSAFATADFNEDGHLDIVTGSPLGTFSAPGRTFVLFGNGDGTYRNRTEIRVGPAPYWIATGDLNRDGHADYVTTYSQTSASATDGVSVVLGNGDGTFADSTNVALKGDVSPQNVEVVDLNGDGNPDVVTSNGETNDVSVLLGLGDGTFQTAAYYDVGDTPYDVIPIDVNGDSILDLATSDYGTDTVSILLGVGDGTFTPGSDLTAGNGANFLGSGDFNGDGRADLAVANFDPVPATDPEEFTVSVFLSNSSGGFNSAQIYNVGESPITLSVKDQNDDGLLDLLVTNTGSDDFSLLLGVSDGTFAAETRIPSLLRPNYAEFLDVNNDGLKDIVSAQTSGAAVFIALGQPDGSFQEPSPSDFRVSVGTQPRSVKTADLDGDGILDLVTPNFSNNNLSVNLGLGDGTFTGPQNYDAGGTPVELLVEDFNKDGVPDVVTQGGGGVGILIGIGDGSFQERTGIQISSGGLQAGDFNEDGNLDLVSATNTNTNTNFNIALGNGNGTFQSPTAYDTGATSNNLTVGDFNNDFHLDVASYGRAHEVRIALGDGSGSFVVLTDSYPIAGSGGGRDLFVGSADFNGDGNIDIVADRPISGDFTVLLGAGDGTFQTLVPFNVGFGLGKAEVADINGDGTPDLITTFFDTMGFITSGIGISVSNGDGTFKDTQYFYAGGRNFAATVGDFNGDGAVDVATANLSGASVTILLAR